MVALQAGMGRTEEGPAGLCHQDADLTSTEAESAAGAGV